jgi:hypothetical protein
MGVTYVSSSPNRELGVLIITVTPHRRYRCAAPLSKETI